MDRRKSLKALALGGLSTGLLLSGCKDDKTATISNEPINAGNLDRQPHEIEEYKRITSTTFFTKDELTTITLLADIIIPKDQVSGSASDAKVPEFIEFIVKDMPYHQTPMRGGIRWLNLQCIKQFGKPFNDCSAAEHITMVDQIAYPAKAKPGMKQGVAFFNRMRDLTASGFYTSEIGVKDIGYKGNQPNQWNGVPDDILKEFQLSYSEKELKECISFPKS